MGRKETVDASVGKYYTEAVSGILLDGDRLYQPYLGVRGVRPPGQRFGAERALDERRSDYGNIEPQTYDAEVFG